MQNRISITQTEKLINCAKIHKQLINLYKHNTPLVKVKFYDGDECYILHITRTRIDWINEDMVFSYLLIGTNLLLLRSFGGRLSKMKISLQDLVSC